MALLIKELIVNLQLRSNIIRLDESEFSAELQWKGNQISSQQQCQIQNWNEHAGE